MEPTCDMSSTENSHAGLQLQEFCDMDQLYRLIDNWSKSSGMSAVIVDAEGNATSESFGMTEFCQMIHDSENGMAMCMRTRKSASEGIYLCPIGFCDFSLPIALPDSRVLGRVLAGQSLSVDQRDEDILRETTRLGLDEAMVKDRLSRMHRGTPKEMECS